MKETEPRTLLAGHGEIGRSVEEVLGGVDLVYDITMGYFPECECDILLVAFPYYADFVDDVKKYQDLWHVVSTVIFSTVPIGTTRECGAAVHSPVEGKHPKLAESMRKAIRWVGGEDEFAISFLKSKFGDVRVLPKPEWTEFLKLQSTSKYGVNIVFAGYVKAVADAIGMPYEIVKEFEVDYNRLYKELGMPWAQKYLLDPPEGKIGGHCVVPNAELLHEQYPHEFLRAIFEYGK